MKRKIILSFALLVLLMPAGQVLSDEDIGSAEKFFNAGEYKKAIGLLKKITREDPSNANAWVPENFYRFYLLRPLTAIIMWGC